MRPRDLPARTSAFCLRFASAPWIWSKRSPSGMRHHMHQQPAHAPLGPKSFSNSGQDSGVSSRTSICAAPDLDSDPDLDLDLVPDPDLDPDLDLDLDPDPDPDLDPDPEPDL